MTKAICTGMEDVGLKLFGTKNVVIASNKSMGGLIQGSLRRWNVKLEKGANMLGVGTTGGVRRTTGTTVARIALLTKRAGCFAKLRRMGINVARVLATGGTAVATYGMACQGAGDYMLLQLRRTVAGIIGGSAAGKDPNMVLIAAGAKAGLASDPAFAAHVEPIGQWAEAVWHRSLPGMLLHASVAKVKQALLAAKRPWAVVKGPAAATVASAARIGWTMMDAVSAVTDTGRVVDFQLDSPAMIRKLVRESVKRWRWRVAEASFPSLAASGGRGAVWEPIQALIKSGKWAPPGQIQGQPPKEAELTNGERAALRSAVSGGQWPQDRLFKASLVDHPFCILCMNHGIEKRGTFANRYYECETVNH